MIFQTQIHVSAEAVSKNVLNGLVAIAPDGNRGAAFDVTLTNEDPRLGRIMEFLNQCGVNPRPKGQIGGRNVFSIRRQRKYEVVDFDSASYLQMQNLAKLQEEQERDKEGRLIVAAWRLMPEVKIGCVLFQATVVSDAIRREMEAEGLIGIQFRELALKPSDRPLRVEDPAGNLIREVTPQDTDHIEKRYQFWELSSSITLPPLDTGLLVCPGGQPFTGDYSKVITIRDDYMPPELHYRASDLAKVGPFDFALTFERFARESWPVVSQRFRQFCVKHSLKLDWIPVRIDPETDMNSSFSKRPVPPPLATPLPPLLPPVTARKHHFEFTHTFIPTSANSDKAGAFLPALANAVTRRAVDVLWIKFGQDIVPAHEVVPPIGLEAYVFRVASHVAYLFVFPRALRPEESQAGLLVAGPMRDWPVDPASQVPVRYFVLDRGTGEQTRIREWTAAGYRDHGPGPTSETVNDFSDVVLYRICGFPEEGQ